jgi:hypothetical protein
MVFVISPKLGIKRGERERRGDRAECNNQRIEGRPETRQYEGDMLPGADGLDNSSKGIADVLHLG